MPRANPPPKAMNAAAVGGRGKAKATPGRVPPGIDAKRSVEKVECPLCIEDMDETDLAHKPCPCGYQICAFCYEEVKLKCRSMCPGCRRVYGSAPELTEAKDEDDGDQALSVEDMAPSSSYAFTKPVPRPPPGFGQNRDLGAALACALPKNAAGKTTSHARKLSDHSTQAKRPNNTADESYAQHGLPNGAAWGSPSLSRQDSVELPSAVDETAWPSLADSSAAVAAAPPVPHRQQQRLDYESSVSRVSSSSCVGLERAASCTSETSVEAHLPNGTLCNGPSVVHANFHATVNGVRRAVCVPLVPEDVDPVENAHLMVSKLQHDVRVGHMGSRQAAAELLALLKSREREEGRTPSLLSCGRAPPGFASVRQFASDGPILATSPLNNSENPIVSPPTAKCRPISPPLNSGANSAAAARNFHANGAPLAFSTAGSMWTNSCLPGIDVSLGGGGWQGGNPGTAYQVNLPTPVPVAQAQLGPSNLDPPVNFSGTSGLKPPPPGFGPTALLNANTAAGYRAPYAPIGARYNPLEFSTAKNPAPGMPAAYRPPLVPQTLQAVEGMPKHE